MTRCQQTSEPRTPRVADQVSGGLGVGLDRTSQFVDLTVNAGCGLHRLQDAPARGQTAGHVAEVAVSTWSSVDYHHAQRPRPVDAKGTRGYAPYRISATCGQLLQSHEMIAQAEREFYAFALLWRCAVPPRDLETSI